MRKFIATISATLLCPLASAAMCSASANQPVALVELYTSEGCSSCPPADEWLATLARSDKAGVTVVPLALHVPYWDYIGWRDPFASPVFEQRQRDAVAQLRSPTVYTPQVLFNGRDMRSWRSGGIERALQDLAKRPARARLQLSAAAQGSASEISVSGSAPAGSAVFLARYENGLVSNVRNGENAGVRLRHDQVVRDWISLGATPADGKIAFRYTLANRPDIHPERNGLAAFVQDRQGVVLQAVMLPACGRK